MLKQADGIGNGDVDIRLLHAIAQAGVEDFDFSGFLHLWLHPFGGNSGEHSRIHDGKCRDFGACGGKLLDLQEIVSANGARKRSVVADSKLSAKQILCFCGNFLWKLLILIKLIIICKISGEIYTPGG